MDSQDGHDMISQCDSGPLPCPQSANPWAVPDGPLIHLDYDTVHFKAALQICCILLPQKMRDWEHSYRPLIEYYDTSRLLLLLHSVRTDLSFASALQRYVIVIKCIAAVCGKTREGTYSQRNL